MNPATKPIDAQPAAHLRLVSDRAAGEASGIKLSGVSKTYRTRDGDVPSLRPLDFDINEGEFFVVVGPSGCGKSTLLKLISGLLPPTSGEILVDPSSPSVEVAAPRPALRASSGHPTPPVRAPLLSGADQRLHQLLARYTRHSGPAPRTRYARLVTLGVAVIGVAVAAAFIFS